MWLAGLVAAVFFGVGVVNHEPPQQTWRKFAAWSGLEKPSPTPTPSPAAAVSPIASPAAGNTDTSDIEGTNPTTSESGKETSPSPDMSPAEATTTETPPAEVAPQPTPQAARGYVAQQDPLVWLAEHPDLQPKTVVLTQPAVFSRVFGGLRSGSVKAEKATEVRFIGVSENKAVVSLNGATANLPVEATDLLTRTRRIMVTMEQSSQTTTETRAPEATPAPENTPESTPAATAPTPAAGQETSPATTPAAEEEPTPEPGASSEGASTAPAPPASEVSDRKQHAVSKEKLSVKLEGETELHLTSDSDPLPGSTVDIASPNAWLFFDNIPPSEVEAKLLDRVKVNGQRAKDGHNIRLSACGPGTVVIPHGNDFEPMEVFDQPGLGGKSMALKCYEPYDGASLKAMKGAISSFRLKRGYTATIATEETGGGASKNYVAQDCDIEVKDLPQDFDKKISFVRIFPWRWTGKKGVAGGIGPSVKTQWFYNWNISDKSTPDVEYVPIAQKRGWPSLKQDWRERGASNLLAYNEPDHKDQSNLTVDAAIEGWPELLATGLRLGSPAVSDGGLGWLYQFIDKADAAKLRVDFIAVHYYRAVPPGDARAAAEQFRRFLNGIHERTKRPIWVTEWNNGANWTNAGDPGEREQKDAIEAMLKMLDETPFVERYAIYNWVEDCRAMTKKDGSLTPAGEIYRDNKAPVGYQQAKR